MIFVNFWGVVHGARTFIPIMLAHDEQGTWSTLRPCNGQVHSGDVQGITKHAVIALTEAMNRQLAQRETKLAVSVLCADAVHTRRQVVKRLAGAMPPAEVADVVVQAIRDRQWYVFPT